MGIVNAIQIGAKQLGQTFSKESPSILTGMGVVGLVTTTILAIRATPKALYLIEQAKQSKYQENGNGSDLSRIEIVKATWKVYIPTIAVGMATAGCIIGSNSINIRRNMAIAGAYSFTEEAFRTYQEKVIEVIGKNKEEKVRDEIAQDRLNENPLSGKEVILTGKGDTLFFDSLSGRYFKNDLEKIRRIQNDFNEEIISGESYKPINDLYYEMGLEATELGRDMGWSIDNLLHMHFSAKIAEGTPCIVIEYKNSPQKL